MSNASSRIRASQNLARATASAVCTWPSTIPLKPRSQKLIVSARSAGVAISASSNLAAEPRPAKIPVAKMEGVPPMRWNTMLASAITDSKAIAANEWTTVRRLHALPAKSVRMDLPPPSAAPTTPATWLRARTVDDVLPLAMATLACVHLAGVVRIASALPPNPATRANASTALARNERMESQSASATLDSKALTARKTSTTAQTTSVTTAQPART